MLRQLKEEDTQFMLEWMHDSEINCWFQNDFSVFTEQQALEFIKNANEKKEDKKEYHYAISAPDGEYLGTISLKNIDMRNQNAEYAICLRRKAMGKGLAFQATQDILEMAFIKLHLNKVYLNVMSENEKAICLYERCGFRCEGEWINHLFLNKKYHSLKWYGLQRKEWMLWKK